MRLKAIAIIFGLAFFLTLAMFPPSMSKWTGEAAEVTIAYVTAPGMHSGIFYDRDFDWPTGEALWIDLPACWLHVFLLSSAALFTILHYRRLHRKMLAPTSSRAT
jgi:hypothetical protein